jgi:hypothetical protein
VSTTNSGSWGYRLLVVDDPDGKQLFFNYPNENVSGMIVKHAGEPSLALILN